MANALSARRKSSSVSAIKGGKVIWIVTIVIAVLTAGGMFFLLNSVASTTTYYVLNQQVPARTQVTPEMLQSVVTSAGSAPANALTVADVSAKPTYTKFALNRGDILTSSNTGGLTPIAAGIPDTFVVASFTAPAENAVAGRIQRGNYIDVIAVSSDPTTGDERAKYVLRNVLVLDVNPDLSSVSEAATADGSDPNATASDSAAARGGIPSLYTVGLSPDDAAKLALVANDTIHVVLSPAQNAANGAGAADIAKNQADVFGNEEVGDSGAGTDPAAVGGEAAPEAATTTEETAPAPAPTDGAKADTEADTATDTEGEASNS